MASEISITPYVLDDFSNFNFNYNNIRIPLCRSIITIDFRHKIIKTPLKPGKVRDAILLETYNQGCSHGGRQPASIAKCDEPYRV